jgi:hypothetical protein
MSRVDVQQINVAFENVFDQALVFHGFTDYMRDYDVFGYATADPRTRIPPDYLRYCFKYCVRASAVVSMSEVGSTNVLNSPAHDDVNLRACRPRWFIGRSGR